MKSHEYAGDLSDQEIDRIARNPILAIINDIVASIPDDDPGILSVRKPDRNAPCICGSGKKYKKCCGSSAKESENAPAPAVEAESLQGEPTLQQRDELFFLAAGIKQFAPWRHFQKDDLITIMLPGREEPIFCSVTGSRGQCHAVAVYPGYEAIAGFRRLSNAPSEEPGFIAALEQHCLVCYFEGPGEGASLDHERYAALNNMYGIGENQTSFRVLEPGYCPSPFNAGHAALMIRAMRNLFMVLKNMSKTDIEPGDSILRFYSREKQAWFSVGIPEIPMPALLRRLTINDDVLIKRLMRKKLTKHALELDLVYLPTPIQEREEDRPYLPQVALLADRTTGYVFEQHIIQRGDDIARLIIEMISRYITALGRPAAIHVRNDKTEAYLSDLCEKINVTLTVGEGMPALNEYLNKMRKAMDRYS